LRRRWEGSGITLDRSPRTNLTRLSDGLREF